MGRHMIPHGVDPRWIGRTHVYGCPGRYQVVVKAIDIFGNDTMTIVPVNPG